MSTTALVRIHSVRSLGPSFFHKRTLAALVRLVATALAFAPGLAQAQTTTHIQTDGSLGAAVLLDPQITDSSLYVIGEDLGAVINQNLYHSFEQFDLATGDTGRFTGSSAISNVVSRITGANPSHLEGKLESKIPGANFYFLNPNGVLFGQNAQVSVPAAFHVSSAENGSFANGMQLVLDSDTGLPSNLEMAPIERFGFIGGEIKLSGTTLLFGDFGSFDPGSSDTIGTIGGDLSFRGGDIELSQGAKLLGLNKTVTIQASGDLLLHGVSTPPDGDGFGSGIDVANFGDQGPNPKPESIQLSGRNVELGESSYLIAETIGAGCDSSTGASCTGQIVVEATSRITLNPGAQDPEPSEFSSLRFPGLNIDSAPGSSPATILTYRDTSSGDTGSVRLEASEIFLVDESRVQALERDPDNISTPRSTGNVEKIGTILPLPIKDPVEVLPIPKKNPSPPGNGTEPNFDTDPGPTLGEEPP
ncbi:MAG TPA: filamentous hemagglutinin N-terminal domain-containing protein, partial [Myxococcales bacterium]|nr:filamentous hemagglutinin N-terminal domain-containing protein [Myxococcales bacterium]